MKKSLTASDIWELITQALMIWIMGVPYSPQPDLTEDVQAAFLEQEQLWWAACLEGCIFTKWRDCQQWYYKLLGLLKWGQHWAIALIQKLWNISWDQWERLKVILHDEQDEEDLQELTFIKAQN